MRDVVTIPTVIVHSVPSCTKEINYYETFGFFYLITSYSVENVWFFLSCVI